MKKFFVLILAILLVGTMFTGCSKTANEVSINTKTEEFHSYEALQAYAENLDTEKYQIIGDYDSTYRGITTCYLLLIEKAKNESYEVFEFSSKSARKEFSTKVDSNKKLAYRHGGGFYFLIVITENTVQKSTITVKDILQNEENYIVISDDDTLIMIPKIISEFVTSDDSNTVYLETTAGTITKATFCITEEMQNKIQ